MSPLDVNKRGRRTEVGEPRLRVNLDRTWEEMP